MVNKDMGTKLPKKHANIILIAICVLLLSITLDTMMRVKDSLLFEAWYGQLLNEGVTIDREMGFSMYVTSNLSRYFFFILVPMAMGIHTFFALIKFRINKLFVFIWTVLMAGGLAYTVFEVALASIFYYLNIGLYIIVIITLLSLISVINQKEEM